MKSKVGSFLNIMLVLALACGPASVTLAGRGGKRHKRKGGNGERIIININIITPMAGLDAGQIGLDLLGGGPRGIEQPLGPALGVPFAPTAFPAGALSGGQRLFPLVPTLNPAREAINLVSIVDPGQPSAEDGEENRIYSPVVLGTRDVRHGKQKNGRNRLGKRGRSNNLRSRKNNRGRGKGQNPEGELAPSVTETQFSSRDIAGAVTDLVDGIARLVTNKDQNSGLVTLQDPANRGAGLEDTRPNRVLPPDRNHPVTGRHGQPAPMGPSSARHRQRGAYPRYFLEGMENRSPSPRSRQLSTYFPRFLKLGAHREGDGEETPSTLPTPREPLLSISSTPPLQLETNLETENTQPAQNLNDSQHSTSLPNLSSSAPLQGKYKNGKGLGKGKNGDKFIDEDDDEESEESSSDLEDDGESGSTEDW